MDEPDERLESWKRIAAYLKRDVRTVQRWEAANGLPIHRHQRTHRALPCAYKKELDEWWARQSQSDPALRAAPAGAGPSHRLRAILFTVSLALVIVAGGFTAFELWRAGSVPPKSIAVLPF